MGKVKEYFKIGGIDMLLFKAEDMVFHTNNKSKYQQKVILAAEPDEYPELLKSFYSIALGGYWT